MSFFSFRSRFTNWYKATTQTVTTTQNVTGLARLEKVVSQTITGLSRITATVTKNLTGLSRISASSAKTITGKSDINAVTTRTTTGLARVTTIVNKAITGVSRISAIAQQIITGKGRIEQTASTRTNHVTNPNFEADTLATTPNLWSHYGNTGNTADGVTNDFSKYGSQSFKISQATSTMDGGILLQATGLTIGNTYTLSAWVKTDADVTNTNLTLDTTQNGLSGSASNTTNTGASNDSRRSVTLKVDQTAVNIFIGLGSFGAQSLGTVWVDGIMLELQNDYADANSYFDGSITAGTWAGTANASKSSIPVRYVNGLARISAVVTKTINGISRITGITTQPIVGLANILNSTARTITGLSRLTNATNKTITGISRLTATTLQTIQAQARITAVTSQIIQAVARIQNSVNKAITGVASLVFSSVKTVTGLARITNSSRRTIQGKAMILSTVSKPQARLIMVDGELAFLVIDNNIPQYVFV